MPSALLAWFQEQGKLGGKRRAESLSPKRRREIGRAAIAARWAKRRKETKG